SAAAEGECVDCLRPRPVRERRGRRGRRGRHQTPRHCDGTDPVPRLARSRAVRAEQGNGRNRSQLSRPRVSGTIEDGDHAEPPLQRGDAGVISRSGTLTYEIVKAMTRAGFGQSTCIGIGGDPILGTSMVEALALFQKDRSTKRIVLVGEIGGTAEEDAAHFTRRRATKPVRAYVR